MFDPTALKRLAAEKTAWEAKELAEFLKRQPEARTDYRTGSGMPVQRLYTPEDIAEAPADNIGLPGRFPYTRVPYPTMYRGRNWTMRQIAGFGTGADTNGRFRYLIEQGQTGLSVDFGMPTLMGYDSDDPRSLGEVGREGVAIDTLDDMIIVRGENIYPSAIEDTLRAIDGFGGEFRVIVSRRETMDELLVRAEYTASHGARVDALRALMRERLRARLGVHPVVDLVPEGTLPRTEFKAKRVIDDRDLYREGLQR